jgi:hypothetical protein
VSHLPKPLSIGDHTEVQAATLAEVLDKAIAAMWPRRAQQELLLDLGERKGWTPIAREAALDEVANWLVCELGLPSHLNIVWQPTQTVVESDTHACELARSFRTAVGLGERVPDAAAWACNLAPALGTTAKTLANNLNVPLRSDRSAHRWLRFLSAASRGQTDTQAWYYHRRCAQTVADALADMHARSACLHAGDAVLVLSLLAQWQHRRHTATVRSNRGKTLARRVTPKPLAGLVGQVLQPGQTTKLVQIAQRMEHQEGLAIALLAIEVALFEAHLAPHPVRSVGDGSSPYDNGQSWLVAAETALKDARDLIAQEDVSVFAFRIERHRAWLAGRPQAVPDPDLLQIPYVAASMALDQRVRDPHCQVGMFDASAPGLFMLQPLLRSKCMLKEG